MMLAFIGGLSFATAAGKEVEWARRLGNPGQVTGEHVAWSNEAETEPSTGYTQGLRVVLRTA